MKTILHIRKTIDFIKTFVKGLIRVDLILVTKGKMFALVLILLLTTFLSAQQKLKTHANSDLVLYTNKEGLPSTNYEKIIQTKDGYIWVSGIEGTYRFNGYDFEEVGKEIDLPKMQNLHYDSLKNVLYFASPSKFITFDGKVFKTYTEKDGYKLNGLPGRVISFVNADSKGRVWIGSETPYIDKKYNGGLTQFYNGKFSVYDSTNFPLDNAENFIETPNGDLIFSSSGRNTQTGEDSYVALFKNNVFRRIDESVGITLQRAVLPRKSLSGSIDQNGNTWIAFRSNSLSLSFSKNTIGVMMYDGNKFHQFTDFVKELDNYQFPLLVFYSKQFKKLFLTTGSVMPAILSLNSKYIFEYKNGKWIPSEIMESIRKVIDTGSGKAISNFQFANAGFTKADKYFPELLILQTTAENQTQSSNIPNQMFAYKNGSWIKYDAFPAIPYEAVNDGSLIYSKKGFGFYYPNFSKIITEKDGLIRKKVGLNHLTTDRKGNVWITYSFASLPVYAQTFSTGLNIWDGKKIRSYKEKDGLKSDIIFKVFPDKKMNVWIPTSKGITLSKADFDKNGESSFKFKNIDTDKRKNYNSSMVLETSKGDIYAWQDYVRPQSEELIEADFFLGKYNGEKFVEINSPFSKEFNKKKYQLLDLREDNEGRLWLIGHFSNNVNEISSTNTVIMIYDGNKWSYPPSNWNVPNEELHYVGNLKNGMYFLSSSGFFVFNGKKFVNLSDSVNANADFRILKRASVAGTKTDIQGSDRLYIRLRGQGLVIFDGTNLKFYTRKDGLPSSTIANPIIDYKGNVFFGFPYGTLQVKGDKFQAYYDDESLVSGGSQGATLDGSGNLVAFYSGVGLFINKVEVNSYPLKITSVSVDSLSFHYNYPQTFTHNQNSFMFSYAAFNFRDPRQTTYEYILEGFDKDWSRSSTLPFVEYQNLPPGKYRFRVKGITSNGVKTNEDSYSFSISPPWWLTWWAYGVYFFAFVSLLGGIRKYELERRKEVEKKRLLQAEHERKTKELNDARQLQYSMLPKELPTLPHLDIAVYMKTATEVGGDYYDFHVHPDGTLTVILGDATGHGMMSGMMVSIMKSLFMSDRSNKELKPFFENASAAIKDMQLGRLMMALTCVQIKADRIITTNAGMPPLYLYRSSTKSVEEVVINNMPLGAIKGICYEEKELKIDKGDTLLLMSDGFAELKNNSQELYSYKRAKQSFENVGMKEPEEIVNHLKEEGRRWTNDADPDDDVTFVVIKVK
ncbi:MAG: guanylate cyclase [Ignavibacteria bacterium]|nr:MAG: guanylate cyclase [Ignavibacteria bacterium]KAF0159561.1 MAG: guanylate cyclase [Ignavibacteria bacterium]